MSNKPRKKTSIVKTIISTEKWICFWPVYSFESKVMFIQRPHSAQQAKHLLTIA